MIGQSSRVRIFLQISFHIVSVHSLISLTQLHSILLSISTILRNIPLPHIPHQYDVSPCSGALSAPRPVPRFLHSIQKMSGWNEGT